MNHTEPSGPEHRADRLALRPGLAPLAVATHLAAAAAFGAVAAGTWGRLAPAAWWGALVVGALALAGAARRWLLPARSPPGATPPPASTPAPDPALPRLRMLERRARQFDEAEKLVAVGSYDWWPATDELHWSEQHFRLWGYAPGAVVPSFEVYRRHLHPEDAARVEAELQQALAGRGTYDCLHRVRRDDGSVRHVRARGEVFFDAQGRAERMIGAVLDITERVEAEARLRLNAFVLDAMPDAVSVIDAGRRYRLTNAAWHAVTGIPRGRPGEMLTEHVFPLVPHPERYRAFDTCLAEGRPQVVRGPSISLPRTDRIVETRYLPFRDPEVDWHGVLVVSRDVTEDEALRQRLLHSVDNLVLTLNTIGDAIFATDAHGPDEPVLFVNDQLRRQWHIPAEAEPLTARRIIEHARGFFRDPAAEIARIEAIIAGNLEAEDRLELNDGRVLLRRCIPTARNGREVRIWVFRDITAEAVAQRERAASEGRQRELLEAFPGYIWVVDAEHRLVYVNARAAAVYEPVEARPGMPAAALFGDEIYERLRPAVEHALAGEALSFEWQRVHDEPRLPDVLLVRLAPGTDTDGRPLCHAFGVDITSLKQARDALRLAKDEAERANAAKTQFVSAISHELRTPLNAVIGFSQLLLGNDEGNLSERQLRRLDEVRKAGSHLLALINDLLDLSRIEAGHVVLEPAPLALDGLVAECLALVQPQALERGCTLVAPEGPLPGVRADRMRLKQVLLNLLSNAVKFNRPGGRVWLQVEPAGPQLRITVRDEGPGLSAQARARLFQPFERLEADRSGVAGTGIGLALSRRLVLAMDGEIGVDSEPGAGCSFWLRLPRADGPAEPDPQAAPAASAPAAAPLPPAAPARRARRLAYVDDNPVNLVLMEGLFDGLDGYVLQTFGSAGMALQALRGAALDLLLVDLQMPVLDGFELVRQLRTEDALRTLPVVAVTADATDATRARCRELGFAGHVTKPVDAGRLFEAVEHALGGGLMPG